MTEAQICPGVSLAVINLKSTLICCMFVQAQAMAMAQAQQQQGRCHAGPQDGGY